MLCTDPTYLYKITSLSICKYIYLFLGYEQTSVTEILIYWHINVQNSRIVDVINNLYIFLS